MPHRWLVVGNTVSPYLLELFDRVAANVGHEVLFVHQRRRNSVSFAHERGGGGCRKAVEEEGWRWPAILRMIRLRPTVVVCLGYTNPLNVGAVVASRLLFRAKAFYCGDTNSHHIVDSVRAGLRGRIFLMAKRAVLGAVFPASLDLGCTNRAAARLMGIRRGAYVPVCAVDFELLTGAPPLAAMIRLAAPRLVCVARVVEEKNLLPLVRAWARHIDGGGAGSLTIVGGGPLRELLEAESRRLPANRILIAGPIPREDIGSAFAASDGLVLASTKEPWGIVVTEALGLGLPVLATDAVGAARSLRTRAAGAIQICGTGEDALAQALGEFVSALPVRRTKAQAVSAWVREKYGMDSVAAQLVRTVTVEGGDAPEMRARGPKPRGRK